jgi:hypothetical protein
MQSVLSANIEAIDDYPRYRDSSGYESHLNEGNN